MVISEIQFKQLELAQIVDSQSLFCEDCKSVELVEQNGFWVCPQCGLCSDKHIDLTQFDSTFSQFVKNAPKTRINGAYWHRFSRKLNIQSKVAMHITQDNELIRNQKIFILITRQFLDTPVKLIDQFITSVKNTKLNHNVTSLFLTYCRARGYVPNPKYPSQVKSTGVKVNKPHQFGHECQMCFKLLEFAKVTIDIPKAQRIAWMFHLTGKLPKTIAAYAAYQSANSGYDTTGRAKLITKLLNVNIRDLYHQRLTKAMKKELRGIINGK